MLKRAPMDESKSASVAWANASCDAPSASPTWNFGAVNRFKRYSHFCTTNKEAQASLGLHVSQ